MSDLVETGRLMEYADMAARLRAIRGRVMLTQLPDSKVVSSDELELIAAGRFGDLLISDWEIGRTNEDKLRCVCGCGEPMQFSIAQLQAMVYSNWDTQYMMAIGSDAAANPPAQPYWCMHIQKALEKGFPAMHDLHKRAMTQIRRTATRGQGVAYALGWMDRSLGLYEFIKDVGLPPEPGMELVRVTSPGHTAENFRWSSGAGLESVPVAATPIGARGTLILTDMQLRKINSRYTSLRSRVLTEGRGFGWNSFAEFLESLKRKAPTDFSPERYQLRFINTDTYGYCERSMGFHQLGTARQYSRGAAGGGPQAGAAGAMKASKNYARAPWNAAIEIEDLAERWPLMDLDLSPSQYIFFCMELSRRMASEPGDVHEHIAESRIIASCYKA